MARIQNFLLVNVMAIARIMVASGFLAHCLNIAFGPSLSAVLPEFTETRLAAAASLASIVGCIGMIGAAWINSRNDK